MTEKRIRPLFCDLQNFPRGKYVMPELAKGGAIGFSRGTFAVTLDRDLTPVPGSGLYEGLPDMELMVEKPWRESWQDNTVIALGDLHVDGAPFDLCARSALKRAIARWQERKLTPKVGLEFEAYVFQQDEDGVWRPYDTPGAFVYGTGPANDPRGLMDALWQAADKAGLPVESINGEFDNGQFELTLRFDDPLKACDDAFLFRTMAKEIALSMGLILSFMAKPIPERGGSGLHVNMSLADAQGANVIAPNGTLSDTAKGCVAGLMHHHEGLAGLLATTVNSYDRLQPASMAGYWGNWANDHRLVTVRTATVAAGAARLEHRMADGATNPYLAVATVLQAALLGLENSYPLPDAEDLDGLDNVRATRHVPSTLVAALDALDADKPLREAVGSLLCDAVIALKRDEAKRLTGKTVDEVRDFYLPFV